MNKLKKFVGLGVFAAAVSVLTAFSVVTSIYRIPTGFMTPVTRWDSTSGGQAGGLIYLYLAGSNETLKVGDVAYLKANNSIGKSATAATNNTVVGVVVGGQSLSNTGVGNDSSDVGTTACAGTGKKCWVMTEGRAWVKTADSVYVGQSVLPSTAVAGAVMRKPATLDSLKRGIGRANFTIDSGKKLLINVHTQ